MRLIRLDLRAFGSFADAPPVDLGDGTGLHLIVGPNEAGKSTALRAIRRLLFGFPLQAGDDHLHKYDNLRVGATVRDEDGRELAFVRRKNGACKFWTPDDSAPILDPDPLGPFLGEMDQDRFVDLFSMDHAELVEGGRTILRGGGRVGEMLFAAGSGLAGVDRVREALEAEADGLFKPTGKLPAINDALARLRAEKDRAETAMLATSDWVKLEGEIARAHRRRDEVDAERREIEADRRRKEAVLKALPIFRRREDEAARLDALGGVTVLDEGFAGRRMEQANARDLAGRVADDAASALDRIARELAGLGAPDPVLAEAEAIGRVQAGLSVYLKERRERPVQESKLAGAEEVARALLAEFLPGRAPDDLGGVRALASRRGLVQELAQQLGQLEASCRRAEQDVEALAASLPARADTPTPNADRLAEALAEVADRSAAAGDLEGRLADERVGLAEAVRQAEVGLRALSPGWPGSLDELEALAVPSLKTIDRFEADLRDADEAIARARAELARAEDERAALDREIEAVRIAGPVPTEADLGARRAVRDADWRLVRDAWLGEGGPVADPPALADRFEAAVRAADDLADRLRREADRVAEQSRREADRQALLDRVGSLTGALARSVAERARVADGWLGLWRPLGLAPTPPKEMRDWVAIDQAALAKQAQAIRSLRARDDRAAEAIARLRSELGRGLSRLGEAPDDPAESLAALTARARSTVARVALARQLDQARSARSKAGAALGAWKARWAVAVGPLGLGEEDSPASALRALDGIDRAIRAMEECASLGRAIAEAGRVERQWEADVLALLGRLRIDPDGAGPEAAANDLIARLDRAREAQTRRRGYTEQEAAERSRLDEARAQVDRASAALATLAREARCGSVDDLPEAERASDEVKEIRKRLRGLDERLDDLAGTVPIGQFLGEIREADEPRVEAEVASLADRLAPLEAEHGRLGVEIGRCSQRLDAMDGGPAAADAQQAVEERVARLALDVGRYARLRLASAVLREAVERHRKQHQGPVLDRAGALFAGLTAGSFSGLRADLDDKGEPVLLGVRADGTTLLKAEGMSEGTADQLYLALRLASLQTYLDDHEPMPLVVDDILVNFDNARALAALRALADLAGRTQVLFFTHHDHLVDLARSALGPDVLSVCRLDEPPAVVNGHASNGAGKPRRKKRAAPASEED